MQILFIDRAHPVLKTLLEGEGHSCLDGTKMNRAELLKNIAGYDGIIIRSRISIDREFLDAAIRLKFIARAGAGVESIDIDYATQKGIVCLASPEGSRDAVGEHAAGMLLALLNKIPMADREVRNHQWNREANRGVELHGKTVGIIGYGNMGKSFAKKISGFDCNIIAYDKYLKNYGDQFAKEIVPGEMFESADILSLHIPLTPETEFMVNDSFISRFKKNFYLVNTARGKIVKTDDLVKHMKAGKITGACIDTIEYEETSFEGFIKDTSNSAIPEAWHYLIHSHRTVLSPHIAGWTVESNEKIARVLFSKIKDTFPK